MSDTRALRKKEMASLKRAKAIIASLTDDERADFEAQCASARHPLPGILNTAARRVADSEWVVGAETAKEEIMPALVARAKEYMDKEQQRMQRAKEILDWFVAPEHTHQWELFLRESASDIGRTDEIDFAITKQAAIWLAGVEEERRTITQPRDLVAGLLFAHECANAGDVLPIPRERLH